MNTVCMATGRPYHQLFLFASVYVCILSVIITYSIDFATFHRVSGPTVLLGGLLGGQPVPYQGDIHGGSQRSPNDCGLNSK